ncbi:MAG TPA: hypothetical protein VND64_11185, partial [Pirellulales bacterium]|nr:hypothetical protein [Pirellulales bacterium]
AAETGTAPAAGLGSVLEKLWPEFAEYDCFACHHDLQDKSWRREGYAKRPPDQGTLGVPRWGTWYYPLLSSLLRTEPRGAGTAAVSPHALLTPLDLVTELRGLMQSPAADRQIVAAKSRHASLAFDAWAAELARQSFDREEVERLLRAVANRPIDGDTDLWDGAAQLYLALVALRQAHLDLLGHPSPDDAAIRAGLVELHRRLTFPPLEAPGRRGRYESPRDFNPDKPREPLREIRRLLRPVAP